jgi:hypothetical protein
MGPVLSVWGLRVIDNHGAPEGRAVVVKSEFRLRSVLTHSRERGA